MSDRVECRMRVAERRHHGMSECEVTNKWCMDLQVSEPPSHGSLDARSVASSCSGEVWLMGSGVAGPAAELSRSAAKSIQKAP